MNHLPPHTLTRGAGFLKGTLAMTTIQEPHIAHNLKFDLIQYRRWVFCHMPALGRLLDNLDAGNTPTFLDIMAAISESVAFYTECDSNSECPVPDIYLMSGKYCRFCS